ncbi:MAG: DUF4350 domain-containing protein [Euzebyaceae bacterium]|nr:DUF4350 domain-containing protein [Euzebyaceae bacterium]
MIAPDRRELPRRYWPVALLIVVLLAGMALVARQPDPGLPLDPASAQPDGTKALVEILRAVGASVEVVDRVPRGGPSSGGPDTLLVLVNNLPDPEPLRSYVRQGGRLVIASGPPAVAKLEPVGSTAFGLVDSPLARDCDLPALVDASRVRAPDGLVYEPPATAVGCFPRGGGSWLIATANGTGTEVVLGGAGALTNGVIGAADNAVLAVALLAPQAGTEVAVVGPDLRTDPAGSGGQSLLDLLSRSVRLMLLQLAVAFLLVVAWRARRLGRPVSEAQQVQLEGSELVTAVGNLLQQTRARRSASQLLRDDLRRGLVQRLGLTRDASAEQTAGAVAARTTLPADDVLAVLTGPIDPDDAQLVALAQRIQDVRRAVETPLSSPGGVRVR